MIKENEMKMGLLSICTMLLASYGTESSARYVDTSSHGTVDELRSRFGKKGGFQKSYVSTEKEIIDSEENIDEDTDISDSEENNVDRIRKNFGEKGNYRKSWLPKKDNVEEVDQSKIKDVTVAQEQPKPANSKNRKNAKRNSKGKRKIGNR